MAECIYCHIKPSIESDGYYRPYESEIELVCGGWTSLYIGADQDGKVIMRAAGDGYTNDWYPSFCPVCGRKLNTEVE